MWKSNTSSSIMKKLFKTRNLSIENRIKFVIWVSRVKASGLSLGMYRLVSVLCNGQVGMVRRLAMWKIENDVVVYGILLPDKTVFSHTPFSLTNWKHLEHSRDSHKIYISIFSFWLLVYLLSSLSSPSHTTQELHVHGTFKSSTHEMNPWLFNMFLLRQCCMFATTSKWQLRKHATGMFLVCHFICLKIYF